MSYTSLPFLQIPLHNGYLHLLLFGFPVLSVYRSYREFDAEDTISLMVWGGVEMVPSMKGVGVG